MKRIVCLLALLLPAGLTQAAPAPTPPERPLTPAEVCGRVWQYQHDGHTGTWQWFLDGPNRGHYYQRWAGGIFAGQWEWQDGVFTGEEYDLDNRNYMGSVQFKFSADEFWWRDQSFGNGPFPTYRIYSPQPLRGTP